MTGRRPHPQDPVAAGVAAGMAANGRSGDDRGGDSQARGHAAAAASAVKPAGAGGDVSGPPLTIVRKNPMTP